MILRLIIFCFIFLNISPTFAYYASHSGLGTNYGGFNSKLKMNQPKVNIIGYDPGPRRGYHGHCRGCRNSNYYLNNNLNALERYALKKNYGRESDIRRLERLENLAFGAVQSGDPAIRFKNVESAILSRPQNSYRRSILGNIANYFSGQATGFTPSIIGNDFYPGYNNLGGFSTSPNGFIPTPGYNNRSYEQYSNGIFGGGWGFSGNDYGSGTSVRILD